MYGWGGGAGVVTEVTAAHHYKYSMEVSPFPAKLCGCNVKTAFHLYYYYFTAYAHFVFTDFGIQYCLRIVMNRFQIDHINIMKIC